MHYVEPPTISGRFVLGDVVVVDVRDGRRTSGQDVQVTDGRISAIGSVDHRVEADPVVDGAGAFVVPGFADMHAHPLNTPEHIDGAYALMLCAGVVGYRQMSGSPALLADRAAGRLPAPVGAPDLLATPGSLLTPLNAGSPEAAVAEVSMQYEQGADFIKAGFTSHDPFLAAAAEARRLGLPLVGHLPDDVDPRDAARAGVRCIEHLGPGATVFAATSDREQDVRRLPGRSIPTRSIPTRSIPTRSVTTPAIVRRGLGFAAEKLLARLVVNPAVLTSRAAARRLDLADRSFEEEQAVALAELFVTHETWHCPTLIRLHTQQFPDAAEHRGDPRLRFIAPAELTRWRRSARRYDRLPTSVREALQDHWAAQLRLTKIFADAGVSMLAGTDACGAGWVIPGYALHDEFDLLAEAGVDPATILRMATSEAARFLDRRTAGQVAVGYDADLVLLDRDPIEDHRALHEISGVVRAGAWWPGSELAAIERRLRAVPTVR